MTSIPSSSNRFCISPGGEKCILPERSPFLLTTLCAGIPGMLWEAFIAQPTMRLERALPRYFAIAPYDVTLPCGMSRTTSKTDSKKSLCLSFRGVIRDTAKILFNIDKMKGIFSFSLLLPNNALKPITSKYAVCVFNQFSEKQEIMDVPGWGP